MIRRSVLAGFLGAGLLGTGLAACGAGGRLDRLAAGERGKVVDVRSGETIVLDSGLIVRLTGIEAPNPPEPLSREAAAMTADMLSGQNVSLFHGGARRDRYGRALAHVRRDHDRLWAQEALLRAGLARVHTWPDNRALAAPMLAFEALARQKGRGLWSLPEYGVLLPSEAANRRGFLVVEGRISRVTPAGRFSRISFAEGGLDALVPPEALPSGQRLDGRIIRVRGWSGGGAFRIDHPEAVELLRS